MTVCYNKLWKLLIDRKMKKKELMELSGISKAALYKLTKDKNVNIEVLVKICTALDVDFSDIVELKKVTETN